jgi:two-component system sensor histidine kinase CpxA
MRARLPLSVKIGLVALLNVLVLGIAAALFVEYELGQEFTSSFLLTPSRDRALAVARQIALELNDTPVSGRNALLTRYADDRGVTLLLFRNDGTRLAGPALEIPPPVMREIVGDRVRMELLRGDGPEGRRGPPPPRPGRPEFDPGPDGRRGGVPPLPTTPPFLVTTDGPSRYWVGVRIPVRAQGAVDTIPGTLVFVSSSLLGNPFYFQPTPWVGVIAATLLVTALCWLPFVRGLTRAIGQMTQATGEIAGGRFDVAVPSRRHDELGTLAHSIQQMAAQLKSLVTGQKRFLGDAAHELRSPLARIAVAIGLLERTSDPETLRHLDDLREDVEAMTSLTDDLLAFARAELGVSRARLVPTRVADAAQRAIRLEAKGVGVTVTGDPALEVVADPDLLCRVLANLVRNAVQHAPGGAIRLDATRDGDQVRVAVSDEGPGVPDADLPALFTPFHRPEASRDRRTGGAGLGLAIVRTAIEACAGSVACRNLTPRGFEVSVTLRAA